MRMKKYEQYKPTGISWLPEIPAHWEEKRLATRFHGRVEANSDFEFKRAFKFNYGSVVPKNEVGDPAEYRDVYVKYSKVLQNDILINGLNLNYDFVSQRVAIVPEPGIVTSAYVVLRPFDTTYAPYFCYLFKAMDSQKLFHGMGTGIRLTLSFDELKKQLIPIPSIEEQKRIVAYLDKKITLIESCKCQRERELQTLNELKQAEIASVVTRGLNPNAPMKDSGQIQFGEIPAHWDSVKMKYCFTQRSEKGFPNEPVLCATQSKGVIPQSLYENRVVVVNKGFEGLKLVKVGDFVISLRSFQGGIEYAYYQGIISAAYTILTPKDERNSQYFKYLFKSHPFIQLLQTCVTGIREGQNINYAVLGNNFIPIPPIEEQNAIVEYIEAKTNSIDKMIDALKAEIDRLTEYKQRLISDVVTGQLNVQDEIA